jgi:hypothetical protein
MWICDQIFVVEVDASFVILEGGRNNKSDQVSHKEPPIPSTSHILWGNILLVN